MKTTLSIFAIIISSALFAQRKVSVVELFTNTGDYDARLGIPALHDQAVIADTNDENHIFIQHNVTQTYSNWTDQYANANSTARYNEYVNFGIVDSLSSIATNGVLSVASPWYNCNPVERDVYDTGAKKVSLLFESYNQANSTVAIRFVLGKKYTTSEQKKIYIFMLESGLVVNVTGAQNAGQTFTMNNVARGERSYAATVNSDTVQFILPAGANTNNIQFVAYIQDDATGEILGGTRGIKLQPYLDAPGTKFSVVEMFCNTGCYGGPPAISSMQSFATTAETNGLNQALVELHIYQTYGNWDDIYTLGMNNSRYDKYSWDLGILAGLAAVSKNGIRYTPDVWNSCKPEEKVSTSFVDVSLASYSNNQLIVDYTLSGNLMPHDKVYFYVVESGLSVLVTGGEISGTTLNMSNVARVGRMKDVDILSDTVLLEIPSTVNLQNARILAYIQNDVTFEVTGGTKGLELDNAASAGIGTIAKEVNFEIYPNPTSSSVTLMLDKLTKYSNAEISIVDVNGQTQFHQSLTSIPSAFQIADHHLSKGIYFVKVQCENETLVQKLEIY